MVAQYIAARPILDLCGWSAWEPGVCVSWQFWEQDGLDLDGAKERAATESDGEEAQNEEVGLAQEDTTGWE